jgi:DNA modification methylase
VDTGSDALQQMLAATADAAGLYQDAEPPPVIEDEAPAPPADPITKLGDLWILGEHRLLCGDSTKAEDVERLMAGAKASLCFTSPPYNSKDGGYKTDYSGKTKKFYNHQCDDRTEDEWVEFCNNVLSLASSHLESEDSPVIWNVMYTAHCRSGYGRTMFAGAHGLSVKETICWDKGAGFPTASRGILSRNWELVFVLSKGNKYTTTQGEDEPRWAKWDIPRPKQQEEHKATFPVDLAARAMCDFGAKGDSVYEPFCGSGTTLIAAEQLGRKCYGMEISPAYCDVIVKRWETLTGKKATLEK